LDRAWTSTLTVVVGPAGAGKSTAVGHLIQRTDRPALWYRAHPVDADLTTFIHHVGVAVSHGTGIPCTSTDLTELAVHFERIGADQPVLLAIDEFDAVIGTETERALASALDDLPPLLHLVTLSRHRPSFNLTRLRLADALCEIGPDDLRFRSWEVDRLFRELYERPLPPDEVAELERRTGGWVAALQLFHLATARLPAFERRAAIAHVGRRVGPDWDFLAENVVVGLSDELQRFLLDTVPFERLTAELCDDLREANDSARHLRELERLQLVTSTMEHHGSFRAHEVLRAHVEAMLREAEGADSVHKRYRRAAEALEHRNQFAEALLSYCRGEDWLAVSRLLGARGAEVAARPGSWLLSMPATIVQSDPWLVLAVARQQRGDGRIAEAIATFERVERSALTAGPAVVAQRERLLLASLVDRSSRPSLAWVATLREAVVGDPVAAANGLAPRTAHDLLAVGVALLVAAEVRNASDMLTRARDRAEASPPVALAAAIALLVTDHLAGVSTATAAVDVEREAAVVDVPFLTRLARAAAGLVTGSGEQIDAAVDECDRAGDVLGATLGAALAVAGYAWGGQAVDPDVAMERCQRLGSPALLLWVQSFAALRDWPGRDLAGTEAQARRRGSRPLHELALLAATVAGRPGRRDAATLAERLSTDHGLAVPTECWAARGPAPVGADGSSAATHPSGTLRIRCFDGFEVRGDDDVEVDLSALRPRARAVLRMLAVRGGGVHRDALVEELWPGDDELSGAKKLQVAISAIRRVLDPSGVADVVRRRGELYQLAPGAVDCDVARLAAALAAGRSALTTGDAAAARTALGAALDEYRSQLLPEEGTADWIVAVRAEIDADVTSAAAQLADLWISVEEPARAVAVCQAALRIDRYCDPVWRLLLRALQLDHDHAGHAMAAAQYDAVLAELGVSVLDPAT
jgi:DNA-binding SARP family transcriptional activator